VITWAAILAVLSGVFSAVVVCHAVRFKLYWELVAAVLAIEAMYLAAAYAGDARWPLALWGVGFGGLVLALRLRSPLEQT